MQSDKGEAKIIFEAIVYKVSTLVDNGVRVTLDLPESAIPVMAMLAECKRRGIVLKITCTNLGTNERKRDKRAPF